MVVMTGPNPYLGIPANGLDNTGRHEPKAIAIVGAGIAGLTAALELARVGHSVTVLEARHRPGGRIRTLRGLPGGLHVEAGAAHIASHHTLTRTYAGNLGVALRQVILEAPNALIHVADSTLTFADYTTNPTQAPFALPQSERGKAIARMWRDATAPVRAVLEREGAEGWKTIRVMYRQLTLREFLEQAGWSDAAIRVFTVASQREPRMNATAPDELYALMEHATAETYEFADGADRLPHAMFARIADSVRFGARVTGISDNRHEAMISYQTTSGVQLMRADHVLVTTPAPVTEGIEFTPGLTRAQARALRSLTYYPATVTALTFSRRWWEDSPYKLDTGGTTVTDLPIRRVTYPTHAPEGTSRGVLRIAHIYGPDATTWAALPAAQRRQRALSDIVRIHPEASGTFEHAVTRTWGTDPYALGGVSAYGPDDWERLGGALSAPQGRVWFAGEHTSPLHGTIEGAIDSGLRAASGIHAA